MSEQLIKINVNEVTLHDDLVGELAKGGGTFLPYVQIAQPASTLVTEDKAGLGSFVLNVNKDEVVDLSRVMLAIPMASRPKTMNFHQTPPLSYYNPATEEFQALKKRAINDEEKNTAAGYEFLIWIPDQNKFATFFLGSKSARPMFKDIQPAIGKYLKFSSKSTKNSKGSWFIFTVAPSSEVPQNMPSQDLIDSTTHSFLNPKDSVVEEVSEESEDSSRE